jgi:hypothetical protein
MKRFVLLILVSVALLEPSVAHAARVPLPPSLTIHEQTVCPDGEGSCSLMGSDDIFIAPGHDRRVRWHEIGHQFDRQLLTDDDRTWFTRALGRTGEPWDGDAGVAETFADAYAACAIGIWRMTRRNGMRVYDVEHDTDYVPTPRQYRRVCNGIAVLGLVRGGR